MKDPVRLQIGGSPEVQDLLRTAQVDEPTRVQLDHLASRLAPVVSAPAASGTIAIAPWLIAATVAIAVVAIAWWVRDRDPLVPAPVIAPAPIAQPPAPPPTPGPRIAAPVLTPEPAATSKPEHPKPPRTTTGSNEAAHGTVMLDGGTAMLTPRVEPPRPSEMQLLGPAHQALGIQSYKQALELTARHRELYASGAMSEEREAIAIEALLGLGSRDAARARFDLFTAKFPQSGYRSRLERLLTSAP